MVQSPGEERYRGVVHDIHIHGAQCLELIEVLCLQHMNGEQLMSQRGTLPATHMNGEQLMSQRGTGPATQMNGEQLMTPDASVLVCLYAYTCLSHIEFVLVRTVSLSK